MNLALTLKGLWKNNCSNKLKITLFILVITLLAGFWFYPKDKMPAQASSVKLVETETLRLEPVQQSIRLIGTIHPKHSTLLLSKSSGLLDILLFSGQRVKKGDLIAQVTNLDIEKNYQLSITAEDLAKTQYQRLRDLQKTGYLSRQEVDEKKQNWLSAQKELARTKTEWENLHFYAPFDGIIGAFKAKEGTQVHDNAAIVTVYDPNSLSVEVDIPCSNLTHIEKNQPAYVFKQRYRLNHIQKMIDDETHMCPADIDIQCEDCLIGSSVSVDLVVKEKQQALTVPIQAVFLKKGKPHVYKLVNNKTELRPVTTGIQSRKRVEITSGLKAGYQIITINPERLFPGTDVSTAAPSNAKKRG